MQIGVVGWLNSQNRFGFIQPDQGGQDVFMHISAVERAGFRTLDEGHRHATHSPQVTGAPLMDRPADPALHKYQLKADEYRARAQEAFVAADHATLERVRDQRQAAAVTWAGLADAEEARLETRRARLSEGAK